MSRRYWYKYISGDAAAATSYQLSANQNPAAFCPNGGTVCAIYSQPSSTTPNRPQQLSSNLLNYIGDATGTHSPNPPANPYVYVKLP